MSMFDLIGTIAIVGILSYIVYTEYKETVIPKALQ
jgi:Tfp pilus assembly protein PilE